ncbi:hypothetical protein LSAT2_031958 [Lamellibrachia satsuma]|nr:hypothetical protein LSAT2_031958 [Lamellibrachia satsuma]
MGSYSFPIHPIGHIVETLNQTLELAISDQDFSTPKKERLMHFYTMILGNILHNMNPEIIHLPQLPMSEKQMEFPELHEEAVPLFNLTIAMQRVVYTCGLENFHVGDILQQKPKRLQRILSAFVNFMQFQEERYQVFCHVKKENEAVVEQRNLLLREIDELQQKVNEVKATRAQHEPEVMHLKRVIDELCENIDTSHKTSNSKRKALSETKTNNSEKKAAIANLQEELVALRSDGVRLSSHIVQSPERMKTEQERMAHQLSVLRETRDTRLGHLIEQRKKQQMQAVRASEIDTACKLMTGVKEQVYREKEAMLEVEVVSEVVQSCKDQLKECSVQETQLKHRIVSKEEKISKLTLQHNNKMTAAADTLSHLQQQRECLRQQHTDEEMQLSRLHADCKKLTDDAATANSEHLIHMTALQNTYSQVLEQLDYYHMKLGQEWTKFKQGP